MNNMFTTKYEYIDKSIIDRFADFCLAPCRYFFNGRKVEIVIRKDLKIIPNGYEEHEVKDPLPRTEINEKIINSFTNEDKSYIKTCLSIIAFVPGLFIGGAIKIIKKFFSSGSYEIKSIKRYDCIYSLKKTAQKKMEFQLSCAKLHQDNQIERNKNEIESAFESWDDKTKNTINELNNQIEPCVISGGYFADTIGRRKTMEDAHLATEFKIKLDNNDYDVNLYGVFDGHGGIQASKYLQDNLQITLCDILQRDKNQKFSHELIANSLTEACVQLDIDFRKQNLECGTTAVFCLIVNNLIFTANVGDSRAIVIREGSEENSNENFVVQLTEDAKLDNPRFKKSIINAGGEIVSNRINGLACARDIGFTGRAPISPRPKITCVNVNEYNFLVLACDGLWDEFTSNEVGEYLLRYKKDNIAIVDWSKKLIQEALYRGSMDNISVMIINVNATK